MTGSRMVGTIANEMARQKARYGVVTMCIGGGQGAAACSNAPIETPDCWLSESGPARITFSTGRLAV